MRMRPGIALIAVAGIARAGCSSPPTPEQKHEMGCVAGTVTGGVIGGLAGSLIGGGAGNVIATGAGASLGAYVGNRLTCP